MDENLLLDPVEETGGGRVEVSLHSGSIFVGPEGPSWGDAAIEQSLSEAIYGQVPVDFSIPNRRVEIPLIVLSSSAMTFAGARRLLQQKVALIQQQGGILKRQLRDGSTIYLDVVNATLSLSGSTEQAQQDLDDRARLVLETLPDWYGEEIELTTVTTADGRLLAVIPHVPGDYPARLRAVLSSRSAVAQRSLVFATRHSDTSPTAAMDYLASALTPIGASVRTGTSIEYTGLPPTWVGVLSTDVDGAGPMTHNGTHRILALTTRSAAMQMRWEYAAGSDYSPELRPIVAVPAGTSWTDLGQVVIPRAAAGAHEWTGRLLVNPPAGATFRCRRLLVLPVNDACGRVNAPTAEPTAPAVAAWDELTHAAGTLDGKRTPSGLTWAGAGSAAGAFLTSGSDVYRDDAGDTSPRFATLPVGLDAVDVRCTVRLTGSTFGFLTALFAGVTARYVDASNCVTGGVIQGGDADSYVFALNVIIGGVENSVWTPSTPGLLTGSHAYRLVVDPAGTATLYIDGVQVLQTTHAALGPRGALARGAAGIFDHNNSRTTGRPRRFSQFSVGVAAPVGEAVLFPGSTAELSTTGFRRAAPDGVAFAAQTVIGDHPRLPVSGAEGRAVEFYARLARAVHGQPDEETADAAEMTVLARPCFLFTPDGA